MNPCFQLPGFPFWVHIFDPLPFELCVALPRSLGVGYEACRLDAISGLRLAEGLTWGQYGTWMLWSLAASVGPRRVVSVAQLRCMEYDPYLER